MSSCEWRQAKEGGTIELNTAKSTYTLGKIRDARAKVVDIHYHVISPTLGRQITDCIPVQNIIRPGQLETEEQQIERADQDGVDIMWCSVRTPLFFASGVLQSSSPHCVTLARTINDNLATVCQKYPERFMAFAEIPLGVGVDVAVEEMNRARNELGLHGICLQTNYDGKQLDAPEFRSFFEEANRYRTAIHVHPVAPTNTTDELLRDYSMGVMVGFTNYTSISFIRLAYSGVIAQYQNLAFILSNVGGTIPFLWPAIDMAYVDGGEGNSGYLKAPPTKYLQSCYYDTARTDTASLMLTYERVGHGHIMFGSDRPYGDGDRTRWLRSIPGNVAQRTLKAVEAMDVPDEVKAGIRGGNALDLAAHYVAR